MITKQEVKHIAKLARLRFTEKEIEKMRGELSSILDYIEKLKEVDVSKVEPTFHSILPERAMREDYLPTRLKIEKVKKLLGLMPETKKGYLKVKSILK